MICHVMESVYDGELLRESLVQFQFSGVREFNLYACIKMGMEPIWISLEQCSIITI